MTAKVKIGNYHYTCEPRWGYGRPPLARAAALIEEGRSGYAQRLPKFLDLVAAAAIPVEAPDDSPEPRWNNPWFSGLDGVGLYGLLVTQNPRLFIEVGSGNSTKFARRAIRDHGLRTKIISIDPEPRAEVDGLCDEVIRAPVEFVERSLFAKLKSGDILFIDSSHRSFENSDVTMLFLEVLPELEAGVYVHIHDIYLPYDYPPPAEALLYNEQYLLAALMLGGANWLEPLFPSFFLSQDAKLGRLAIPLWQSLGLSGFPAAENSFWAKIRKHR